MAVKFIRKKLQQFGNSDQLVISWNLLNDLLEHAEELEVQEHNKIIKETINEISKKD